MSHKQDLLPEHLREEFLQTHSMIDAELSFFRINNLFFHLKSLMLEGDQVEKALEFGAFLRKINNTPDKEDLAFKKEILEEADKFLSPFLH